MSEGPRRVPVLEQVVEVKRMVCQLESGGLILVSEHCEAPDIM